MCSNERFGGGRKVEPVRAMPREHGLDADAYLRRFPHGRFAAAAARIGSSVAP
jgi:hypothetical protein